MIGLSGSKANEVCVEHTAPGVVALSGPLMSFDGAEEGHPIIDMGCLCVTTVQ